MLFQAERTSLAIGLLFIFMGVQPMQYCHILPEDAARFASAGMDHSEGKDESLSDTETISESETH